MKNIYLISDTHFGQRFAVKFFNRPFKNTAEMHRQLIKNWNNMVDKDDFVVILGDFFAGSRLFAKFLLRKLHGEKILIKGNHDFKFRLNKLIETKKIKIYNKVEFSLNDYQFILTHKPIKNIPNQAFNIHGHHHRKIVPAKFDINKYFNVAVEHNNYRPISIKDIIRDKLGNTNIDLSDIIDQIKYSHMNKQYVLA